MFVRRDFGVGAAVAFVVLAISSNPAAQQAAKKADWSPVKVPGPSEHPPELLQLATEVRAFRDASVKVDGVVDYAATAAKHKSGLDPLRQKLDAMRTDGWSVHSKIDYLVLRSELDDVDFDLRVLRPTTRNPSFYLNNAIRNVYRLITGNRYLRGDIMPYSKERAQAILRALADTDKVLAQGRKNLTEIVPELADIVFEHPGDWPLTEGGQLKYIEKNYEKWAQLTAKHFPEPEASQLIPAAAKASHELKAFGDWLEQNRSRWTGKAAFGLDALNWYTHHVMLMPFTVDQLRLMADMERARVLSFFEFESQKNRHLPKIEPAKTTDEYLAWEDETGLILRRWYTETQELLSDRDYMLKVKGEEGLFMPPFGLIAFPTTEKPGVKRILVVPADHWRAARSNMGFRTDPGVLHGHEYWPGHYYQGEIQHRSTCPIRPAHNDNAASQGWCNYLEEMPVHMNFPFVRGPRARELVYINMLQRSERVSLSIKVIGGELTPKDAMAEMRKTVPPLGSGLGAGPEEVYEEIQGVIEDGIDHGMTGKLQIFKMLADRKMQLKEKFDFKEFNDQVITLGSVPFALIRWEITGLDDEVKDLWKATRLSTIRP
jgi:Bacterial protein of unknown function (DUF885)